MHRRLTVANELRKRFTSRLKTFLISNSIPKSVAINGLLMPSNNLARCGISPINKNEKIIRLGQHLSKAISETDASLKKVA